MTVKFPVIVPPVNDNLLSISVNTFLFETVKLLLTVKLLFAFKFPVTVPPVNGNLLSISVNIFLLETVNDPGIIVFPL